MLDRAIVSGELLWIKMKDPCVRRQSLGLVLYVSPSLGDVYPGEQRAYMWIASESQAAWVNEWRIEEL